MRGHLLLVVGCVEPPAEAPIVPLPEPVEPELVGPSSRIIGLPGMDLRQNVVAVPAQQGDPSVLLLTPGQPSGLAQTFIVPGALPPGEHGLLEIWDGVSAYAGSVGDHYVHPAGDLDDDGHSDLWIGDDLHLGPLLGRLLRPQIDHDHLETYVVAAGFDADGDGHEDVLMGGGAGATLHYGPFEGTPATEDPSQLYFDDCSGTVDAHILRDHLGPGRSLISLNTGVCSAGESVFELQQPRGAVPEAVARSEGGRLSDVGDLDGDGQHDVVYGGQLLRGPVSGWIAELPPLPPTLEGHVLEGLGDLDGDGIQELLGMWTREDADDLFVILFSPHAEPLDLSFGMPLIAKDEVGFDFGKRTPDLDGDGLPDLLGTFLYRGDPDQELPPEREGVGEILVWYAKDLLAARP